MPEGFSLLNAGNLLQNFLGGGINSDFQLLGSRAFQSTYSPTTSSQTTSTYAPTTTTTTTRQFTFSPSSQFSLSSSPQSVYSPQIIFNSAGASAGVAPQNYLGQSASLTPSLNTPASSGAQVSPSVSPTSTLGVEPNVGGGLTTFDLSALLPFILVGAVLYFTLKGGK